MRFLALLGPTASGKSALALALAERRPAEIVACDSQQVYAGMDIGTAKPTADERRRVPHHGLDLCRPDETFHAARWADVARAAIHDIAARGAAADRRRRDGALLPRADGGPVRGAPARSRAARPPPRAGRRRRDRSLARAPAGRRSRISGRDRAARSGAHQPRAGSLRADRADHRRAPAAGGGAARPGSRRGAAGSAAGRAARAHRGPRADDAGGRVPGRGAGLAPRRIRHRITADAGARVPAAFGGAGRNDDDGGGRRRDRARDAGLRAPAAHLVQERADRRPIHRTTAGRRAAAAAGAGGGRRRPPTSRRRHE